MARTELASYINAPNDTKLSMYAVSQQALAEIAISEGLQQMLSYKPTLDMGKLDLTKPYLMYIILPDEDGIYNKIVGIFVTLFTQTLIRRAQDEFGGRIPVRQNIVLDEVGSIGKAIPNLDNLISASRSRNVRLTIACQSDKQLVDVYGRAKADSIESCFSCTINFSSNDEEYMNRLSKRVGNRIVSVKDEFGNSSYRSEPLLTANQIYAMPAGTALIFLKNNIKYVQNLRMYRELYPDAKPVKLYHEPMKEHLEIPTFSLKKYVEDERTRKMNEIMGSMYNPEEKRESPFEGLIQKIDKRIAELEAEEKEREASELNLPFAAMTDEEVRSFMSDDETDDNIDEDMDEDEDADLYDEDIDVYDEDTDVFDEDADVYDEDTDIFDKDTDVYDEDTDIYDVDAADDCLDDYIDNFLDDLLSDVDDEEED